MDIPNACVVEMPIHKGPVLSVRFNLSGDYCLSCGADRVVKLLNPHKGLLIKTYSGHSQDVRTAVASHDNSRLASGGNDRVPMVWDVGTGQVIRHLKGFGMRVNSLLFAQDSTLMIGGSDDRSVRIWDLRSRENAPTDSMSDASDAITCVAAVGTKIISSSVDGHVRVYDVRQGILHTDCIGVPVTHISVSNDGKCVLASCLDSRLRLLETDTGELLNAYTGHEATSTRAEGRLSHDDACVLSTSEDGRVIAWDIVQAVMVRQFKVFSTPVTSIDYHPHGSAFVCCGVDGMVKLFGKLGS